MSYKIIPDYKIFTDATADFSSGMLQGLPRIEVIPMEVTVGDDNFLYGPGGNLSVKQFYAMQRGGKFATTSQINPVAYRKAFESALKSGYDVLYWLCSHSGQWRSDSSAVCFSMVRAIL